MIFVILLQFKNIWWYLQVKSILLYFILRMKLSNRIFSQKCFQPTVLLIIVTIGVARGVAGYATAYPKTID